MVSHTAPEVGTVERDSRCTTSWVQVDTAVAGGCRRLVSVPLVVVIFVATLFPPRTGRAPRRTGPPATVMVHTPDETVSAARLGSEDCSAAVRDALGSHSVLPRWARRAVGAGLGSARLTEAASGGGCEVGGGVRTKVRGPPRQIARRPPARGSERLLVFGDVIFKRNGCFAWLHRLRC